MGRKSIEYKSLEVPCDTADLRDQWCSLAASQIMARQFADAAESL